MSLPEDVRDNINIAAVGGLSIAGELAARWQTCVLVTGEHVELLGSIQKLLETPYYHVSTCTNIIGAEVSVGLKNLYVIGVGIVQGILEREGDSMARDAMPNMADALFTQSLKGTAYLVEKMGGRRETVYSLARVGDLNVTCQGGRNSCMCHYIGHGMRYEKARSKYMPEETIEDAEIAIGIRDTIIALPRRGEIDPDQLLLLRVLLDIVCDQVPSLSAIEHYFRDFNLVPDLKSDLRSASRPEDLIRQDLVFRTDRFAGFSVLTDHRGCIRSPARF